MRWISRGSSQGRRHKGDVMWCGHVPLRNGACRRRVLIPALEKVTRTLCNQQTQVKQWGKIKSA